MDKKVYDVSFSDIVNNLGKRVSRNDDLALIEFDDYDYQKIKEWLTKNQILGNIEYLRNLNSATHIVRNKFKILSNNILPSILPCQKIHLT